jgi:hypothetical protein
MCATVEPARRLWCLARQATAGVTSGAEGHTLLTIDGGVLRRADVGVGFNNEEATVEIIAHELEHVLEQLDGVDLHQATGHVRRVGDFRAWGEHAYETERARQVGRSAAREYRANTGPALQCQEVRP